MPTLAVNKTTKWSKGKERLGVTWAGSDPGSGKVSVKQSGSATSYSVPNSIGLDSKADGSLTNNTSKTVEYTLS